MVFVKLAHYIIREEAYLNYDKAAHVSPGFTGWVITR
jgi:hypothetical protein